MCAFITRCLRARAPQDWGSQGAISLPVQEGTSDRTLLEASFGRTRHGPGGRHELRLFESRGQNLPDKLQNAVRAFFKMRFSAAGFSPASSWLLSASFREQGAFLIRFGFPLAYSAEKMLFAPFQDAFFTLPFGSCPNCGQSFLCNGRIEHNCCRHLYWYDKAPL